MPAFFVTGTDTEVGKTFVACALLYRARAAGLRACGIKAVAAGTDAAGQNEDVTALRAASAPVLPEELLNPYCFAPPIAPHIAAREAGVRIHFSRIRAALDMAEAKADLVLVEGAGGFRIPLGEEGDSADLALALERPVILVAGMRLGVINHALLTAEAITRRGLALAGWVANTCDPAMPRFAENLATLRELLPAPCLGCLPRQSLANPQHAAAELKLPFTV
jgi:dethiobiotin synthetase